METKAPFKFTPPVLGIVMLTLVALALPFAAISLGVAKFYKERAREKAATEAKTTGENSRQIAALRQMVEQAADKQLKTYSTELPTVEISGSSWKVAKKELEKTVESYHGNLISTEENHATMYVQQKNLREVLHKLGQNTPSSGKPDWEGRGPEDWVDIGIVFRPESDTGKK